MSIIYYPKGSVIFRRDTQNGAYEQVSISDALNSIIYFDTSSVLSNFTGSFIYITASNAVTASYALNASGGGGGTSLITGSTYPITSSWSTNALSASYANVRYITHTLTDGATINTDVSLGNHFRVTLGGNRTLGNPTNMVDGDRIIWEIIQDGTGNRTLTLGSNFRLSKDLPEITLTTESNARDYLTAIYNSSRTSWDVTSFIRGYNASGSKAAYTASYSLMSLTSSYALTSSLSNKSLTTLYIEGTNVNGQVDSAQFADNASSADNATSSSYADVAKSSSYILGSNVDGIVSSSSTSSYILGSNIDGTVTSANSSSISETSSFVNLKLNAYIQANTSSVQPTWAPGKLWWHEHKHTYTIFNEYPELQINIGHELYAHYLAGENISHGNAVYIAGSGKDPNNPTESLPIVFNAIADGSYTKNNVLGLSDTTTTSGSSGWVIIDGKIETPHAFNDGARLWLSTTTEGGLTSTKPSSQYERVQIGYANSSSIFVSISNFPSDELAYSGVVIVPTITNNDDGTITISTGSVNLFDDSTGQGVVTGYSLSQKTLNLITGSLNYIYINHNLNTASYNITTNQAYANGINIINAFIIDINNQVSEGPSYTWDLHILDIGVTGTALSNRISYKDVNLEPLERQSGLTLYVTGSTGDYGITEGVAWYGPTQVTMPSFETTEPTVDNYLFIKSGSVWTRTTSSGYLSGYYNDIDGLAACAQNSWSVNYVYRLITNVDTDDSIIVLSSDQYSSQLEASINGATPSDLPSAITGLGLLVGRLIVQSGSFSPSIESAYTKLFAPSSPTQHNNLTGLQGGGSNEYYHLTSAEYTTLGVSSSYALSASYATPPRIVNSASYVLGSNVDGSVNNSTTSSYAVTASFATTSSYIPLTFSRGGTLYNPDGITAGANLIVWRAQKSCTLTAVKGYRVGGTGATINARKNGTSNHLSSNLSLSSTDTWTDGGTVQNTSYSIGDKLEIMVVSVTGTPTQIAIQVDFTT